MKKLWIVVIAVFFLFSATSGSAAFVDIQKGETADVEYMTGGVGLDERKAMKEMARNYNLKLVFAKVEGHFLANVPVTITKRGTGEKVVETVTNGPWLFAKLPPGWYVVKATHAGQEKSRSLHVGRDMNVAMFHWQK